MSIITGRGDEGYTDLLYGKRIAKTSLRVATLGAIDELNTTLGVVRCHGSESLAVEVDWLQEKLVGLMGELAVLPEDLERYAGDTMPQIGPEEVATVEERAKAIEAAGVSFAGWARPGAAGSLAAAFLDQARTGARRAERKALALAEEGPLPQITLFLNRLSDYLWLLARREES
ncbi:ATP:cob(I)alamin adenosyltransferase [Roseibacillus persicicus]|uniref:Corrinoid adenosyltransferase n=1 Tax=Roseibacillus persicicus TaxID=454148 RepID=A0A918TUE9_9BACT|nr:ATP:cob(I)alamin adenosyltransferase [Roseibacillus persicicus]MDQ8188742.1 ATP:cob(I)alamin adenosyltransferase [Roseibacillus persicicus]GHC63104.1 cob(I)yrinic acid a,c-diamide adenosyltransferase [Roseibacillus persicicus]